MAPRRPFTTLSGTMALVLFAGLCTNAEGAQLPWAATSGLFFVDEVVAADNYRAAAGGLAIKKSPSPEVREFGRELWVDSIESTRRLRWVLNKHEPYIVLPTQVSPHYMFVIDQLVFVSGDEFDRRFIAQQTASLKEALALAQDYARLGDDFGLKEYAARSVPKIRRQLNRALALKTAYEHSAAR